MSSRARDHIAHVFPNQECPIRAWLTCEGDGQVEEVASRLLDYRKDGPDVLEEFFTKAMGDHMAVCEGREVPK